MICGERWTYSIREEDEDKPNESDKDDIIFGIYITHIYRSIDYISLICIFDRNEWYNWITVVGGLSYKYHIWKTDLHHHWISVVIIHIWYDILNFNWTLWSVENSKIDSSNSQLTQWRFFVSVFKKRRKWCTSRSKFSYLLFFFLVCICFCLKDFFIVPYSFVHFLLNNLSSSTDLQQFFYCLIFAYFRNSKLRVVFTSWEWMLILFCYPFVSLRTIWNDYETKEWKNLRGKLYSLQHFKMHKSAGRGFPRIKLKRQMWSSLGDHSFYVIRSVQWIIHRGLSCFTAVAILNWL